ncbi:MAG: hypothetical protein RLZZ292_414 [Bacteroidota bacterium]|jgi:AraC-like DNA-binding protein
MIYQKLKPSPYLSTYIKEYLLIHFKFDPKGPALIKPYPVCPEQCLPFYIRGKVNTVKPDGSSEYIPTVGIIGQQTNRHDKYLTHEILLFQPVFQPGALHSLTRVPMTELIEKNIDAEVLFGKEINEVYGKLCEAKNYEAYIPIFETFLYQKLNVLKEEIRPIHQVGRLILEQPHLFDVDVLARQSCLSTRQFERQFLLHIGISPKFFGRISRFYKAFEQKEAQIELPWSNIAWDTGYTDYQHLAKDFKQFAGTTPNSLLLENAQSPERLIGIKGLAK